MANEANPCPCDIGDRMEYGGLGQEVQLGHTKAYVVKPSTPSDKAIIVIQDIYGWQLPNTRYMADMLAANGYMYVKSARPHDYLFKDCFWLNTCLFQGFVNVLISNTSTSVLRSAICPDFYVGKEPWGPSHDWSKFQEWLEDKKPTNINK